MAEESGTNPPETDSPCFFDKESSSSSEGVILLQDQTSPQNLDLNDYETMEELDFDDEKRDSSGQKHSNVLQTSIQQNRNPESLNGTKNVDNGSESKGTLSEKPDLGKENCGDSEIEEGETVEDGECADIEDGEISEASKTEDLQKISCRFFQRGKCIWGRECRYLHLSDKGLYCMFDSPVKHKKPPMQNLCYQNEPQYVYQPPLPPPPPPIMPPMRAEKIQERPWVEKSPESNWDRALQEAKERIKKSRMLQDDNDYYEDSVHLKVEKADRYVKKLPSYKYPLERHSTPESNSAKITRSFTNQPDGNKQHRWKFTDNVKSNLGRSTGDRNSTFHSEWTDPWRRSKTPPERKRKRSKSLSDSSSVSSKSSLSSWTSLSSRSPSPKRLNCYSTKRKHSYSHPCKIKKSERSHSSSGSSHSTRSASQESYSKKDRHAKSKSFRSPSSSPDYRRGKRFRSPDIVLPYRKPSRSLTPPPVLKKKAVSKERTVVVKQSKSSPPLHAKSKSPSLQSSRALISATRQSCSDMSISPSSDASLNKRSCTPVKNGTTKGSISTVDKTNATKELKLPKICVSGSNKIPLGNSSLSSVKSSKSESAKKFQMQIKPQNVKKVKNLKDLEADFLRFTGFKKPNKPAKKAELKSKPLSSDVDVANSFKEKDLLIKQLKEEPDKDAAVPNKKLSKRDVLLQKLKAVEEAIARKKKSMTTSPKL